ncbi:AsmA-like C-terminal region-containing protein [Verrucomicrobium sp. 3C]|uniref:AsmA-like C-terminal region-containing protein n=1 Tax=Verrucomicrobium sp. 3C TaxID=1134055 RepID=UPI000364C684|nr:AsmA-like C-terminal region-containing protein [Verrucomicrobium sp. 3C]
MRLLRHVGEFVIGLVLAAIVFFFLAEQGLKRWVSGRRAAAYLEWAIREALGGPVRFSSAEWKPPAEITLQDLWVDNPASQAAPALFSAKEARFEYSLPSLLTKGFYLRRARLDRPSFSSQMDREGRLLLPLIDEDPARPGSPLILARARLVPWRVGSLDIANGRAVLLLPDGMPLVEAGQISACGPLEEKRGLLYGTGTFAATWMRILGRFSCDQLLAQYKIDASRLALSHVQALASGGQIEAALSQLPSNAPGGIFGLRLKITDLDLHEFLSVLCNNGQAASGRLSLDLDSRGRLLVAKSFAGQGSFAVKNGHIENISLFSALATIFREGSLAQPAFSECSGQFRIQEGAVTFSNLDFDSPHFSLSGEGSVAFDSSLRFVLRVHLKDSLLHQLPELIARQLRFLQDRSQAIVLTMRGTIQNPEAKLVEKLALRSKAPRPLPSLLLP